LRESNFEGSTLDSAILVQTNSTDANLTLVDLANSEIQYFVFVGIETKSCEGCQ